MLTANAELFSQKIPQLMNTYVHKTFGTIPHLFLVAPLPSGNRYSQLSITYMLAFVLGMLARYFPTHWVSLARAARVMPYGRPSIEPNRSLRTPSRSWLPR
jgi:hypothetical protein